MNHRIVLECRNLSHWFGTKRVLHNINLKIVHGEIVALVGPSGCGKSTLLRAIIGTHPPCDGQVVMHPGNKEKELIVSTPGRDRGIVYQHYALFPFLTARENVAIGLMLDQTSIPFRFFNWARWRRLRHQHLEEADTMLKRLKLGGAVNLYPHQMSGGMRQRVAIAQALIMKPEVLLLDEPFGALDESTREELQKMLLTLYAENCTAKRQGESPPFTIFIVTHELNEALYVGDRIVALSQYWNWKASGHDAPPGATIVYDHVAPVYFPEQERDFESLAHQRKKVRSVAFEAQYLHSPADHVRFWDEVAAGKGGGVLL